MAFVVTPVRDTDDEAVNEICFLNYDRGALPRYRRLAPLRWSVPYLRYEREHCLVVREHAEGPAVGYLLCALNAAAFRRQFRSRMKTDISKALKQARHEFGIADYFANRITMPSYPDAMPRREESRYPAHLHINVHPEFYSRGLGTLLLDGLAGHLRNVDCPGVHLGVSSGNKGAIRFYERYGFTVLRRLPGMVYYGYDLTE